MKPKVINIDFYHIVLLRKINSDIKKQLHENDKIISCAKKTCRVKLKKSKMIKYNNVFYCKKCFDLIKFRGIYSKH